MFRHGAFAERSSVRRRLFRVRSDSDRTSPEPKKAIAFRIRRYRRYVPSFPKRVVPIVVPIATSTFATHRECPPLPPPRRGARRPDSEPSRVAKCRVERPRRRGAAALSATRALRRRTSRARPRRPCARVARDAASSSRRSCRKPFCFENRPQVVRRRPLRLRLRKKRPTETERPKTKTKTSRPLARAPRPWTRDTRRSRWPCRFPGARACSASGRCVRRRRVSAPEVGEVAPPGLDRGGYGARSARKRAGGCCRPALFGSRPRLDPLFPRDRLARGTRGGGFAGAAGGLGRSRRRVVARDVLEELGEQVAHACGGLRNARRSCKSERGVSRNSRESI